MKCLRDWLLEAAPRGDPGPPLRKPVCSRAASSGGGAGAEAEATARQGLGTGSGVGRAGLWEGPSCLQGLLREMGVRNR